jgi:hypothetical protein
MAIDLRRVLLLATCAIAPALIGATSAEALVLHLKGHRVSIVPTPGASAGALASQPFLAGSTKAPRNGVQYHGGPLMPSNTNYTLYWAPPKSPSYPSEYQTGVNKFFGDLAADSGGLENVDSVLIQYEGGGQKPSYDSHFGGQLIDEDPYPPNGCTAATICLTDEQIRAEVTSFVQANHLPEDLEHEYFVLTPPTVESCFESGGEMCSGGVPNPEGYCAYHSYITNGTHVILYADDPYVGETVCDTHEYPNNNVSDAEVAGGLSHEHAESVTDPEGDAWLNNRSGDEVGDLCRTFEPESEYGKELGTSNGAPYNQLINGDPYFYQQEWSNEIDGCAQRAPQAPTVTKVAPKAGSLAGGTHITITGRAFSVPASVYVDGVPAGEVSVNSWTSVSAVVPAGTHTGAVDVTVKTLQTSKPGSKDHFRYRPH